MAAKLNEYLNIDGAVCGHQLRWGRHSVGNRFGCGVLTALDSLIYQKVLIRYHIVDPKRVPMQ